MSKTFYYSKFCFSLCYFFTTATFTFAETSSGYTEKKSRQIIHPTQMVLATNRKRVKKVDKGVGLDAEQNGIQSSHPKGEIGGNINYTGISRVISYDGGSSSQNGSSIAISASYLMILGKYGIGPTFGYTSSKMGDTDNSGYELGGIGKLYFADFSEKTIPFASGALKIIGRTTTTTVPDMSTTFDPVTGLPTTSSSGTKTSTESGSGWGLAIGGGVHYMLGKDTALTPELQYYLNSSSAKGVTLKESGIRLLAGFVVFI